MQQQGMDMTGTINNQIQVIGDLQRQIIKLKEQLAAQEERNDAIMELLTEDQLDELNKMDEVEDDESEDEDEDEMQVYFETETFGNLCGEHEHLKEFHEYHYYQCWGGGPEGGYIVNEKNFVFKVERSWGTPFSVEKVAGFIKETERDGLKFIRII